MPWLSSIIRNNMSENKPVFCAFVNLEKAVDRVDRELLMYRLWQYNIDGKMYRAVKSRYSETECCVQITILD